MPPEPTVPPVPPEPTAAIGHNRRTLETVRAVVASLEKDCTGASLREVQLTLAVARKAAEDALARLNGQSLNDQI